jgi:membrane-associated protein
MPSGITILEELKVTFAGYLYALILIIILAESIVYVGFYFPGQFFAVLLVVLAKPQWQDIVYLTLCMVVAATLGSGINYYLGYRLAKPNNAKKSPEKDGAQHEEHKATDEFSIKYLLIAMIHINSLAFYMFKQGELNRPIKVVWFAGLLNLPYYLLLIFATAVLSEEVLQLAENTVFLITAISIWLLISGYLDYKKYRTNM